MAKMTPEILTEEVKKIYKDDLRAVILYGSAAAGDSVKTSDYNVLIVLERVNADVLTALTELCTRWVKDGNPAPLLFGRENLLRSGDVFPVEFSDIMQTHRLLYGDNPFAGMTIEPINLRLGLEHDLKSKLILLRERFLLTKGSARAVDDLMVSSLSAFLTLFKAILRLYGETPPAKKMDAVPMLARHIKFDEDIIRVVWELKEGKKHKELTSLQVFGRYLSAIQDITASVDLWLHNEAK